MSVDVKLYKKKKKIMIYRSKDGGWQNREKSNKEKVRIKWNCWEGKIEHVYIKKEERMKDRWGKKTGKNED